ncbi:MAG: bifunctional UDP-N-acetylglucosamine diphosphorylase/glucosamine-1-phosphate N-acetyltransferase GlmU [Gammaproteobacteria bacterium]|nr:bifunctional UDP-N-acetylglucosamine diphosphorylase/glucosamine-1-phosphate N-acetyltransferase GlmU [Gammaproteobacteria bacterium]
MEIVVLAAGRGKRMRSSRAKVLHEIAGQPLLAHVLQTARELNPAQVHVVVGRDGKEVASRCADGSDLNWIEQTEQLGTGHATSQAIPHVDDNATVLVVYGDVPLADGQTLAQCAAASAEGGCIAVVTADAADPAGLGRVLRNDDDSVAAIVEDADASDAERRVTEINTGILAAPAVALKRLLAGLGSDNTQGEFYLTDIVAAAQSEGVPVMGIKAPSFEDYAGVNDRVQLAAAERRFQQRRAEALMREGVTFRDPARFDLRGTLKAGPDCTIDVNSVFEGEVVLGERVSIGPNCFIRDAVLGDDVSVEANTVIDGARIERSSMIGPFARLRPGTQLGEGVKIGNFVETKKARLGAGTKASHLAYLGDAEVGDDCNIGAGAITCNYDGVDKHETSIGDRVFVGTNATLVAPVEIGDDAYVGAGSTITVPVEEKDLAVGRSRQRNIKKWRSPQDRKKREGSRPNEEREGKPLADE